MDEIKSLTIQEVAKRILEGNCMLFLGSGFSANTTNLFDKTMPIGGGLVALLDAETGQDSDGDLEEAAENYIDRFGELQFVQFLRETFSVKTLTDGQMTVCRCQWRRIYTTNYDNSVEFAKAKDGKRFLPVTLSSSAQDFVNKRDIVVHLNGSVNNLNSNTISSEFKLTSSSYLTQQFQESEWQSIFEYDIRDSDLIVFIGFSIRYDLDIKKILWEDGEIKNKCVFIMADGEKAQNVRKAQRYGTVFPIGLDALAQSIEDVKRSTPTPVSKLERPFLCFRVPTIQRSSVTKIPDSSITDLFLYGKIDELLLQRSIDYSDRLPYFIDRKGIISVLNQLENGTKEILVHSDLGNGKTLFVKGMIYQLLRAGYKVYEYNKYYANLTDEIEKICNTGDPNTVIVVENYNANRKIIETIQSFRNKQRLIVSERSVTNDMSYNWLLAKVKKEFYEIDVNRLDDDEIEQCSTILNQFGLWRKYSNLRDDEKRDILKNKNKRSLRLILLEVINSTDIRDRIQGEINKISSDRDVYQAMVLMLVSNLLDWNINLDDISYALGNVIKGSASFRRNAVIKEFVDFSNSELKVKSSILSEVILTRIMDVNIVRETLVKAFRNFNKQPGNPEFRKYMMTILSYANLQRVFNKEEGDVFNNNIVILFEDIRNCAFCESNPHYWLQYAIAKLGEQKYEEAKLYFDNAYSYARRRTGFDTYQIDNHFARYLLENVIYTSNDDEFFKAFVQAHSILTDRSHLKDTKYYPFKVARLYLPFYLKYKKRMTKKEILQFRKACEQIDGMIKTYRNAIPGYRIKHEVREAETKIAEILKDEDMQ